MRQLTALLLLFGILLSGCAGPGAAVPPATAAPAAPADTAAPVPTAAPASPTEAALPTEPALPAPPTPAPTPDALSLALEEVRDLIAQERCYAAFQALLRLEEGCRGDAAGTAACEALFAELDAHLKQIEPASGTELARSFAVQGGCVLEINAFSGPVLVAVSDALAEPGTVPNSVRFYVRQGELGSIQLPAGTYYVGYQVGYRWFGESDGFGEYYTEGTLDAPLVFDFYMDGSWASNAKFTITL